MTAALSIRGVTKRFGAVPAVRDLSFDVGAGRIVGFIGPNGAGKTTTMRICATLEIPDGGDAFVEGVSVLEDPRAVRRRIGFMPDAYGAYPNTTVREYLDFFARAYGLGRARRRETVGRVMDFTSLGRLGETEVPALSKGMRQRLCLAKTLLHDPAVLILDEPAAGLDPRGRVELRELLKALAEGGKAVLVSSHILSELAEMCHEVAVIERGMLRATGSLEEIARRLRARTSVLVRCLGGAEGAERILLERPGVCAVRREGDRVVFELDGGEEELAGLLAHLVEGGVRPVEFAARAANLEDLFLQLTEGTVS